MFLQANEEQEEPNVNNSSPGTIKTSCSNLYHRLQEPKPLLNPNMLTEDRPKVLLNEANLAQQPTQLTQGDVSNIVKGNTTRPHLERDDQVSTAETSIVNLWDQYTTNSMLTCVFHRYLTDQLPLIVGKKLRLQMRKHSSEINFPSYILSLEFLVHANTSLLRNLKENIPLLRKAGVDIQFDSRFESGNLYAAFQKARLVDRPREFDLLLQNDVNTRGYNNWFYFRIKCAKKSSIRLNIVNFQKARCLFTEGMKVAVFSSRQFEIDGTRWHRAGYSYSFKKSDVMRSTTPALPFFKLSFILDLLYDEDTVYVATTMPYSYTRLLRFLKEAQTIAKFNSNISFKKDTIAYSLSQNACPILTIAWKKDKKQKASQKPRKRLIVIIARQHPAETTASFVVQGLIRSLLCLNSNHSVYLLQNFVFKIVPMVNVDGVIYGNARCDISGSDVNRRWHHESGRDLYPIISAIRSMVSTFKVEGWDIEYFVDLHSHSRKLGSFMYCCKGEKQEIDSSLLAFLIARTTKLFSFPDCSFGISSMKKHTARAVIAPMVENKRSLTLETSVFGWRSPQGKVHFEQQDFSTLGDSLLHAIYLEQSKDPEVDWDDIRGEIRCALLEAKEPSPDSASDSDPEQDEMVDGQKTATFLPKAVAMKVGSLKAKTEQSETKNIIKQEPKLQSIQKPPPTIQPNLPAETKRQLKINEPPRGIKPAKTPQIRISVSKQPSARDAIFDRLHNHASQSKQLERPPTMIRQSPSVELIRPRIVASIEQSQRRRSTSTFWASLKQEYDKVLSIKLRGNPPSELPKPNYRIH